MIELMHDLYIDADEAQYMLRLRTGTVRRKTGEEYYKILGYYTTLTAALEGAKSYLSRNAIREKSMTLNEAIDEISGLKIAIEGLANERRD